MAFKTICEKFESVPEFVRHVEKKQRAEGKTKTRAADAWCPLTLADALKCGVSGAANDNYRSAVADDLRILTANANTTGNSLNKDVEGQFFDVGDVLAGVPECWYNQSQMPEREVINVDAAIGMSASYSAEEITRRGASIIALVDKLTECGFIPVLRLIFHTRLKRSRHHFDGDLTCIIEVANNPIDLDAVAFMVANPAGLRRVCLAWEEITTKKDDLNTYGPALSVVGCDPDDNGLRRVVFDADANCYSSEDKAREAIEKAAEMLSNGEKLVLI